MGTPRLKHLLIDARVSRTNYTVFFRSIDDGGTWQRIIVLPSGQRQIEFIRALSGLDHDSTKAHDLMG